MAPAPDPQLLKGVLSLLLLRVLAEEESYGYQVVKRLQDLGLSGIAEGSVYPALARLQREGRLEAHLVASPSGPARKYYRPTAVGRKALEDGTASWLSLADVVSRVLLHHRSGSPARTEGVRT